MPGGNDWIVAECDNAEKDARRWADVFGCQWEALKCSSQTQDLVDAIRKDFPNARCTIERTGALCSFYAEEGAFNEVNNVNNI